MKLTHSRIEFLTPIIRNLARRFEPQAGAACGFTHEDLEQEAWLKLSNIAEPPKALDKPAQWFSTVVCRLFVDIVRKGKTRLHPTFYGELNGYDRPEEESLSSVDQFSAVDSEIERLSPRRKEVAMRFHGLDRPRQTRREIAKDMQIEPQTVRDHIKAAHFQLKEALSPPCSS